jgi:hypothetical protein
MSVNKVKINLDGFVDRQLTIPIQLTWDYVGLDQSIDEYESKIITEVIGVGRDFEVTRFAHAPLTGTTTEPTDIKYEFNFYSGGSLNDATNWKSNYQVEGFTTQEIFYYTNNFTNSFFKLDLYDNVDEKRQTNYITIIIPTQQGLKMDAIMQTTPVSIKKPYFVLDYVGDKEGFFIYWLKKRTFLDIDTFYMSAKFFNAKTGQFTTMMTGKGTTPFDLTDGPQALFGVGTNKYAFDNTQFLYYTVKLDYPTQTYQVFNTYGQRLGTNLPIKWYEYVNP